MTSGASGKASGLFTVRPSTRLRQKCKKKKIHYLSAALWRLLLAGKCIFLTFGLSKVRSLGLAVGT